ncbi:chloride channel protein [Magnetofaba australis]|uniref:Putative Cl-channel voltage-gated family protein n=1 Tax=Magnetofaba australis IT-1 TaxID=1434232 RepID=A0A1Y2K2M5_9PROT|nr:chloride channel protein [Magnetofaba australis]OSM02291.1 putative Cl-channel voltage-gated family protein [Magnetofaba australis IT-1]
MRASIHRLGVNEHIILSAIAIAIGILVGYGAILFRTLIELFQFFFLGSGSENVVDIVKGLEWWHVLLAPVAGGAIVGPMVHFLFPGSRGHGVPEVMSSVALHGGKMKMRDGIGKMLACSLSIGSGGSVGREGPVVHVGATISSWLGSKLQMSTKHMRTMVGCGAAAGIAASFNAPIAGVMFALEVILADYGLATFSPIVLSSVIATVIARLHLGDFPAFIVPHYTLVSAWEIPAYIGLGLVCGITGILFMHTLFKSEDLWAKIPVPRWMKPAMGGFLLGAMALVFPQVMGVGYDTMNNALLEQMAGWIMALLVIIKIIATSITLGSGFSGGVFTPSLFLGAMVGGAFGTYAHALFPALSASPGAYTLVGMGAMAAAVLGAPISAILILFELTNDYRIMLALMVASMVATLLINQVYRDSVYTKALRRHNIDLWSGRESGLLRHIKVGSIMRRSYEQIPDSLSIRKLKAKIHQSQEENFLVTNDDGSLKGIVSFQDIRGVAFEEGVEDLVLVRDIATRELITVTPDDNLYDAFRLMGSGNIEQLPVVAANGSGEVLGVVTNNDVIKAYNRALLDREVEEEARSR